MSPTVRRRAEPRLNERLGARVLCAFSDRLSAFGKAVRSGANCGLRRLLDVGSAMVYSAFVSSRAMYVVRCTLPRGPVAQLAEQQTLNLLVEGSIPSGLTSLRSECSRRLSAVALAKADLAARFELRLASHLPL